VSFVASSGILKNPQICTGLRAGRLTLDPEQVPDLAAKIPGQKPHAVHRENTGSARLAILPGKFLGDLTHQLPIPRADGLPQSLLQDCGRGVLMAKGSGDLRRHREA
jgi:hypothetical protein